MNANFLDEAIEDQIEVLAEKINQYAYDGDYADAAVLCHQALDLLPEPKNKWDAFTWLKGTLADVYFQNEQYAECKQSALDGLDGYDGGVNPLLYLRLGQALFELGEEKAAADALFKAYMLADSDDANYIIEDEEGNQQAATGADILFGDDDPKYLAFLHSQYDLGV